MVVPGIVRSYTRCWGPRHRLEDRSHVESVHLLVRDARELSARSSRQEEDGGNLRTGSRWVHDGS
jgi:hypothetical protein